MANNNNIDKKNGVLRKSINQQFRSLTLTSVLLSSLILVINIIIGVAAEYPTAIFAPSEWLGLINPTQWPSSVWFSTSFLIVLALILI
ncbi:MAG: hypothetical protein ACI9EW_002596, partial [Cellvibrionaceae bacterium]